MDKKTQLNNGLNATVVNTEFAGNSTVINKQALNGISDAVGEVLDGKYRIKDKLNVSTGEADLYICTKGKNKFIAKIYRRKIAIKEEVAEKLKSIESPYVAKVYVTGEYQGYPYEILPYYKNGSLEGKTFSFEQLKKEIIPALNEGLKVLHDNGIVHKDLKPSNIMLSNNGHDVAIIDFGISSIRENGNTVIVTRTGMTPEYSAPETFKNLFLSESDYYSLGITLYELYCGHTPYAQMSQEEIEQFVSVQKLPLPNVMQEELKVLISALTYPDITNRKNKSNPNRRWGYEEILKWCVGIKQQVPGEITGATMVVGNIRPYKFLGETYTDKEKLISALTDHWEDGKKQLFRGLLSAYFKEFDAEIAGFCMDAEDEVSSGNEDLVFFKTIYKIDSSTTKFYWKEKRYESIVQLGNELLENIWEDDNSLDSLLDELLKKGVLSQYILCLDENDTQKANAIKAIEASYRIFENDEKQKLMNRYLLAYMLSGRRIFHKWGTEFKSIQELTKFLEQKLNCSYDEFECLCHDLIDGSDNLDIQFESWLLALGKKDEIDNWRNELQGQYSMA